MIIHNSREQAYRTPAGAQPYNTKITLRICTRGEDDVASVSLRLWVNNSEQLTPMIYRQEGIWEAEITTPAACDHIWYYFIIYKADGCIYYGNNPAETGGSGKAYDNEPPSYQITVYDPAYKTPEWLQNATFYQIMTDRFFNGNKNKKPNVKPNAADIIIHSSTNEPIAMERDEEGILKKNDFYGGNIKGIMAKLPHLKELGITALYLNPIFEAYSNHKYDTADYERIDPMFGDEDDLKKLCQKADELGMHIIIDGVFSHTGADSKYFNKYGRYDSIGAYQSSESPYRNWYSFREYPHDYVCWWGCKNLPNVNELEPTYGDYIMSVIQKWQSAGISGWRLDVADELPVEFLKRLRSTVKESRSDAVVIGEVWEDASRKVTYGELRNYFSGRTLDGVMNYPFRDAIIAFINKEIDAGDFVEQIMTICENYPPQSLNCCLNSLSTHDTPRIVNLLGNANNVALATVLQAMLPGSPCIYYGDEVGMKGAEDPLNRAPHPWKDVNKTIAEHYRKIFAIRSEVVTSNDTYAVESFKDDIVTIKRTSDISGGKKTIIAVVNRKSRVSPFLRFDVGENAETTILYSNGDIDLKQSNDKIQLKLPSKGFAVVEIIEK